MSLVILYLKEMTKHQTKTIRFMVVVWCVPVCGCVCVCVCVCALKNSCYSEDFNPFSFNPRKQKFKKVENTKNQEN